MTGAPLGSSEELRPLWDSRTVFRAVWRRRYYLVLIVLLAGGVGIWAGLTVGGRVYQADTVMHYRPVGGTVGRDIQISLYSLMNQVKVWPNLVEVRERLQLAVGMDTLTEAVSASVPRNTTLLVISAEWDNAEEVAAIANTTRNVFLESWVRALLQSLDGILERAEIDQRTSHLEAKAIEQLVQEASARVVRSRRAAKQAQADSLRYQSLRDTIALEQSVRENTAELVEAAAELRRAEEQFNKGLLSRPEYERVLNAYKKQEHKTVEREEASQWKRKLRELGNRAAEAAASVPGDAEAQDVTLKALEAEIGRILAAEKVAALAQATVDLREGLHELKNLRLQVRTDRQARERSTAILNEAQGTLSRIRGLYDAEATEFVIVSTAAVPALPVRSTRRLVAFLAAALIALLGFALVVGAQLLTTRVRSAEELALKTDVSVVGTVPALRSNGAGSGAAVAATRVIAQSLRRQFPGSGIRLAITGPRGREGATTVAASLARVLGRKGERVLVIDADLRSKVRPAWNETVSNGKRNRRGLGTLLTRPETPLADVLHPTGQTGVDCIPYDGVNADAEMLGTRWLGNVLATVARDYSVVIIHAPPVLNGADAVQVAEWCDAVLLIVRGGASRVSSIRKALERLQSTGVPLAGAVLNGADPYFLR